MRKITAFASRDALMSAAADRIAAALLVGIQKRGAACAALSGGETPEPAYRLLSQKALDWSKVRFALVDERFLPPDNPSSNEGLLRRALKPAFEGGARLEPLYEPGLSLTDAADRAEQVYGRLHFDMAVLGMGGDGHTASWFKGAAGLEEAMSPTSRRSVAAVTALRAVGSPERLTLTLAALARADRLLLILTGEQKRALLEKAADEPVAALFSGATPEPETLWSA